MPQKPLFTRMKRPAASIWAMPMPDWLNIARSVCSCWRNLVSMRFRAATCALKARLATEMLSMKAISSTNASSTDALANGPPPANAPQAAKHDRMNRAVAVSRSPHRSAAHNSGTAARNANALLVTLCSMSGLKAMRPTALAATMVATKAKTLSKLKARKSVIAHSTTTGVITSTPAASRSHQVTPMAMKFPQSTAPAR